MVHQAGAVWSDSALPSLKLSVNLGDAEIRFAAIVPEIEN
jgi:hypothetical protein